MPQLADCLMMSAFIRIYLDSAALSGRAAPTAEACSSAELLAYRPLPYDSNCSGCAPFSHGEVRIAFARHVKADQQFFDRVIPSGSSHITPAMPLPPSREPFARS